MSTELTYKEKRLFEVLINHAECIDWLEVASSFDVNSFSGEYVDKAIQLMPKWSEAHRCFRDAVIKCLPDAKQIRYHWLLKALASILQSNDNRNSIQVLINALVNV